MSFDLQSITREKSFRAPRIILLGVEKVGKSLFASGADNPVFIPIKREEGIDEILVDKFPVCNCYSDLLECFNTLCTDNHELKTVIIDSTSTLEPLIWEETCRRNDGVDGIEKVLKGWGKGYVEALKEWRQIIDALDWLRNNKNMASILIGHVKVKLFNSPDGESYDQWQWDIHEKAASMLYKWADLVLFANFQTYIKKEDVSVTKKRNIAMGNNDRVLYTQRRPSHPGGCRGIYGKLPYELPLNYQCFRNAVSALQS